VQIAKFDVKPNPKPHPNPNPNPRPSPNPMPILFGQKTLRTFELLSNSLRFNGHFPGEPGLAGVHCSKG